MAIGGKTDGGRVLRLVIPGLLGPWPGSDAEPTPSGPEALRLPALERLLSRAARVPEQAAGGYEPTVFRLFGTNTDPDRDLPVAAVSRLADAETQNERDGWWLRADPVHLQAELQQTRLLDARLLDVQAEEAADLCSDFNRLLEPDGYRLLPLKPSRWYLRLPDDPGIRTVPLPEVIGRDVSDRLPHGPGQNRWRALLTELQMLAHASDVNSEREWDGQLPINSVWLWGGGRAPAPNDFRRKNSIAAVYARDPLSRGLTLLTGAAARPLPADADAWLQTAPAGTSLVMLETVRYYIANRDPYRWSDRLRLLEQTWFAPLLRTLRRGALAELWLYPCAAGGPYRVRAADLGWRGWHRPQRPLGYHLASA